MVYINLVLNQIDWWQERPWSQSNHLTLTEK